MSILMWNIPKKVMTTDQWSSISADGAPPGVYCPNMSEEDQNRWKATFKPKLEQIEIRRSGLVLVVSLDGYVYNGWKTGKHLEVVDSNSWVEERKSKRIHLSMNGPQCWTSEEFLEFMQAYDEAITILEAVKIDSKRIRAAIKKGEDVHSVAVDLIHNKVV